MIIIDDVDSTNTYVRYLVDCGKAYEGLCVFANHQSAGRGQYGKVWDSPKGENILMTILLSPPALGFSDRGQVFLFSCAVLWSIRDFFSHDMGVELAIKWPNDIYAGRKKMGGVLLETIQVHEKWEWAMLGLGMNLNQLRMDHPHSTSLAIETGKVNNIYVVAQRLQHHIRQHAMYRPSLVEEFSRHVLFMGQPKMIAIAGKSVVVTLEKINEDGSILLRDDEGKVIRTSNHREIDWKLGSEE